MINKHLRILSSTFLVIALAAVISHAQVTTGSFIGFVTDPGGAAISGAKVTATNEATGLTRTATTDSSGEYVIGLLPVGTYTLTFEASNFRRRASTSRTSRSGWSPRASFRPASATSRATPRCRRAARMRRPPRPWWASRLRA